jgi:hypothetical protein
MKAMVWASAFGIFAVPSQAATPVELRFGWHPGMSCQVTNSVRTLKGDAAAIAYTLKTSEAPEKLLLVEMSDARPAQFSLAGLAQTLLPGGNDIFTLLMPDFLVDADGQFVRLRNIEKSREAIRRVFERGTPKGADPVKMQQALEVLGSKAMLENTVNLMWNPAVTSWSGSSWEPQERYSATIDQIFPIGNLPYKAALEAQFVGMQACDDKSQAKECALLTTSQKPDPAALKDMTMKMIEMFGASTKDMESFKLDLRIESETVTRPESLVPSRVMFEKHVSIKGIEKGKPVDMTATERREWVFNCR